MMKRSGGKAPTAPPAMNSLSNVAAILEAAGILVVKNTGCVARTYRVYLPKAAEAQIMTLRQLRALAAQQMEAA